MTGSLAEGSQKWAELATMPLVLMYHSISHYDEDPHDCAVSRVLQLKIILRRTGQCGH